MKCLTNKWREGAMLLSFLLISSLAGIFTACDDIEDEYITDTQLSILRESRTSLNYLLKNSTYGTAPGTYPETGKDILKTTTDYTDKNRYLLLQYKQSVSISVIRGELLIT